MPPAPEIANLAGARRKAAIQKLKADDPDLWSAYENALRQAEGESHFIRSSGRFPLCGRGDVNTYAVFAEVMRDAVAPTGRLGVIVPTGIATDDTTKHFFASCVTERSLASLLSFENEEFVFPGVHHATKFCLLTLSGSKRPVDEGEFFFFARRTADLADVERRFTLSPDDLALINPNTRTAPVFRSRRDAEITKAIYRRIPVLICDGDPDGNPWDIEFSTMFHMTNDSHLFRTADEFRAEGASLVANVWTRGDRRWLPLYEGKMIFLFDHRYGTYAGQTSAQANQGTLPTPSDDDHADASQTVMPRYWVEESEVRQKERSPAGWGLGFRDITSAVTERTLVVSVIPGVAVNNKLPLLNPSSALGGLLGTVLSSFAADYTARQKIGGTTLNFFIAKQIAVLPPSSLEGPAPWGTGTVADWIRARALELTYTAWDVQDFARSLGYNGPPFKWNAERRNLVRAELDAALFHLYGLGRPDTEHVLDSFPILASRETNKYGEYQTKVLILERYDALAKAIATGTEYQTVLDPPPADPQIAHPESSRPAWADAQ